MAPLGRAAALGAAFVALSVLVALGATRALDRGALDTAQRVAAPWLDLAGSAIGLLGHSVVALPLALALALVWWRRAGARGLVPLLVFAGLAIEIALKFALPQPLPPEELSRSLDLEPLLPRVDTPYAYPSGHLLRTTFLASLVGSRAPRWRPWLWALVALMALSRVYLAEHWASDVAGGLLLGWGLAALGAAAYARHGWTRGKGARSVRLSDAGERG